MATTVSLAEYDPRDSVLKSGTGWVFPFTKARGLFELICCLSIFRQAGSTQFFVGAMPGQLVQLVKTETGEDAMFVADSAMLTTCASHIPEGQLRRFAIAIVYRVNGGEKQVLVCQDLKCASVPFSKLVVTDLLQQVLSLAGEDGSQTVCVPSPELSNTDYHFRIHC